MWCIYSTINFIAARPTMERGWLHEIFGNLYLNIQFDTITPCNRFLDLVNLTVLNFVSYLSFIRSLGIAMFILLNTCFHIHRCKDLLVHFTQGDTTDFDFNNSFLTRVYVVYQTVSILIFLQVFQ